MIETRSAENKRFDIDANKKNQLLGSSVAAVPGVIRTSSKKSRTQIIKYKQASLTIANVENLRHGEMYGEKFV